jgi:hypothetical protein
MIAVVNHAGHKHTEMTYKLENQEDDLFTIQSNCMLDCVVKVNQNILSKMVSFSDGYYLGSDNNRISTFAHIEPILIKISGDVCDIYGWNHNPVFYGNYYHDESSTCIVREPATFGFKATSHRSDYTDKDVQELCEEFYKIPQSIVDAMIINHQVMS